MAEFLMPALGADMEAGTLVAWNVKAGDRVKRGDLIAVVETVKGAIDVEVFFDGVVEELLVKPGTTVPVNTPLARIATEGAQGRVSAEPPPLIPERRPQAAVEGPAERTPPFDGAQGRGSEPHLRASPVARRMAESLHVDLASIHGTGPNGAVLKADVEAATRAAAPTTPARRFEPSQMRKAIGAAMSRSKREIPHYYVATEIDLSRALAWLQARNETRSVAERVLPAALLLKACALAVKEVPEVNGAFENDAFTPSEPVHLGVAIALKGGGLIAPGIRDAQSLSLVELMHRLSDLVTRARIGRLTASELGGQTITVTNLGDVGVTSAFPVIMPPQVAMVGFGRVQQRPWVVDGGAIGPRPIVVASLAADHRVSDGLRGARYLNTIDQLLQQPEVL